MPQKLAWLQDTKFYGCQCWQLCRSAACYGAPCTRGVLIGRWRNPQRVVNDNCTMCGADNGLQLSGGEIGGEVW